MANALTLETMSLGLVKVVETCNHEPHRRKSRMREIRSYGSGEGPGWVTSRPTLQSTFAPPARERAPQRPPAAGHAAPTALPARPARCASPAHPSVRHRAAQHGPLGLDSRRRMG